MNKYSKIAIVGVLVLLVAAVIFGFYFFSGKRVVTVTSQNSVSQLSENSLETQQQEEQKVEPVKTEEKKDVSEKTNSDQKPAEASGVAETKNTSTQADSKSAGKIIDHFVSWGFAKADSRSIDTIVIHSNYNTLSNDPYSIDGAIRQFKTYGVSSHYLIDRKGVIYKLVDEKNVAYHAGVSKMKDGRTDVNNFSIGVELMTQDSDDEPTDAQYKALNFLISDIKKRWPIKYIVGHKDIAPDRKTDPWGFDWKEINK